ncbi:MAG: hypothetical protein ABI809_13335, partial [Caldimonas sp.]
MAEPRPTSLLDFAIAASLAVVPVMLAVVWLVAVVRPAEPGAAIARGRGDRYLSVRHVAALKTFEQAVRPRAADAAPPSAAALLDAVPQCRREWGARWSLGPWLAQTFGRRAPEPTEAEHIAAQLAQLDAALLRFSSRPNARVEAPLGFDATHWFAAANASLETAIEAPDYPGQRFRVGCADLALALAALDRADARMLETLAWRGTVGGAALAHWRPDQQVEIAARQVMRRNPWSGLAGCIYLGRHDSDGSAGWFIAGARSTQRRICAMPEMTGVAAAANPLAAPRRLGALAGEPGLADPVDDTRWMVPPSLQTLLQPLESLRQPTGALYRLDTDSDPRFDARLDAASIVRTASARRAPNRVVVDGAAVDAGYSIDLTIDPALQALAQKTAACYTGRHDVCRALGIRRNEDRDGAPGQQLLEGAMVRMAAVAIVDVASGRIEALAGAMSPCARQEVDGPRRDSSCDPRLPFPVRYRADALLNPALFHDAMPASTIKPIMAAAFLSDPEVGARWLGAEREALKRDGVPARDSLRGQLMRSDSARFLD